MEIGGCPYRVGLRWLSRQPRHRACDAYTEVAEGYGHKRSADGSDKYAAAGFGIAMVCAFLVLR